MKLYLRVTEKDQVIFGLLSSANCSAIKTKLPILSIKTKKFTNSSNKRTIPAEIISNAIVKGSKMTIAR